MIPSEVIRQKRDGKELPPEQLTNFFTAYLADQISDAQVAAFLMAATIKGLSFEETAHLTTLSRDSGKVFRWPDWPGIVADKHSTGGVGDKTSLLILPLCLLEGLKIPMMAGRGLGHTGGTLDKLESIPGMKVRLSDQEVQMMMTTYGGLIMGQTPEIVPMDYKLYHLRDVTATVESIPLIVTSILSKKLAEGLDSLVMDVKFGSGAFMQSQQAATELGEWLVKVGRRCGLSVRCLLTNMNTPLGTKAGNWLEILECVEAFQGKGPSDTVELSIELAAHMVQMCKPEEGLEAIRKRLHEHLTSGRAFELFLKIVHAQGGDVSYLEDTTRYKQAKYQDPVVLKDTGFITEMDVRKLGLAMIILGGGRRKRSDALDYSCGFSDFLKVGDLVQDQQPLCIVHHNDREKFNEAKKLIESAYELGEKPEAASLIKDVVT